jgi:queuine/archaeosine tRNA-ribosyltransferase
MIEFLDVHTFGRKANQICVCFIGPEQRFSLRILHSPRQTLVATYSHIFTLQVTLQLLQKIRSACAEDWIRDQFVINPTYNRSGCRLQLPR